MPAPFGIPCRSRNRKHFNIPYPGAQAPEHGILKGKALEREREGSALAVPPVLLEVIPLTPELELKLQMLPDSPGCYLMKSGGKVIYVGKAINLKNRVRQYFHPSKNHTPKVTAMVEKVDDFDIMLVDGELEAFILECNLIKLYMPHYNILLKDDKHYPYIRIDMRQDFPKVELVRRMAKDGAKYFGPFQGATVVREVLDVARMVFPIRICNRAIRPDKPTRPCIQYEIGQCVAPCANKVSAEDYRALIDRVADFLNGKYAPVLKELTERMTEAAQTMSYERAALYRDRIRAVEAVMQKQKAISTAQGDQDVIAAAPYGADAVVQLMIIRSGRLIGTEHFVFDGAGDDEPAEVLTQFVLQYYDKSNMPPQELILNVDPPEKQVLEQLLTELHDRRVYILCPRRGDKVKLVAMALKNLKDEAAKRDTRLSRTQERTTGAMEELADALGLDEPPRRIEGYDISNTQGVNSVGSMVVMIDGTCQNKEYRHFRIKTVEGPNDFASMKEVISRRLAHAQRELEERREKGLDEKGGKFTDLPDLIMIDGGRGQLNAALEAMGDSPFDIPMFGLAKRIEEIVLPYADESLLLDRHSNALHAVQRLRDEAHRFAITHHRALRGKQSVGSKLEDIAGIGATRRKAILRHFKTIEALKGASVEEIAQVPGLPLNAAEAVYNKLHEAPKAEG